MIVVTNEVVTEVVTGGYTSEFPILVTTVTDLSGRVNQEKKQVVSADVMEMCFRWLRGYNHDASGASDSGRNDFQNSAPAIFRGHHAREGDDSDTPAIFCATTRTRAGEA